MNLIEVNSAQRQIDFINVAKQIYKDDPNWISPLDIEVNSFFDPKTNKKIKDGNIIRWVLKTQGNAKLIGRIAAFIDKEYNEKQEKTIGGIGFFECIYDIKAAHLLFDAVKYWLKKHGVNSFDGPINLGKNDSYWGLLVENFSSPTYGMPYHKPYYKTLFEEYGFKVNYNQFSYRIDVSKPLSDKIIKIANWISLRNDFSVKTFCFDKKEKFAKDFVHIYNTTWPTFKDDVVPVTVNEILEDFEKAKSIIIPEFVIFAYHKEEPIGFYINLPDINQIISDFNGKLSFVNKLRLFYRLRFTKKMNRFRGIIYGVVPKFQRSGVDAAIIMKMKESIDKKPWFTEGELSWIGDFNPKMLLFRQNFITKEVKKYSTYKYQIDLEN